MVSIQSKIKTLLVKIRFGTGLIPRVTRGSIVLGIGGGTEHGIRFLRNILLTRLIAPESFGVVALVTAINTIYDSLTQIGIQEAIIQNPKGSQEVFLNGAWWIAFLRGIFLYTIAFFFIPWVSDFYNNPELTPMMRVAMLTAIFTNSISPRCYADLKQLRYVKWVTIFNGGGLIGVITTIVLGSIYHNAWALIIGMTAESASRCLISFIINPFLPNFQFEKEALHSLFRFSRGMMGVPILIFLYNNLDIFLLGKKCSISEVGMYNLANNLSSAPILMISTIISPLIMPAFSSVQDNRQKLSLIFMTAFKYMALIFFPLLTLMACFSPEFLTFAYGKQYAAVYLPFIFLCLNNIIISQGMIWTGLYLATGHPELNRKVSVVRLVSLCFLIYPLVDYYGLVGAAVTRLLCSVTWAGYNIYIIRRLIEFPILKYTAFLSLSFGVCVILVLLRYLIY